MFIFQVERFLLRNVLSKILQGKHYPVVLDVGSGNINKRYNDLISADQYLTIDHNPLVQPDILCGAEDLHEIKDNYADLIIMTDILFCVANPLRALKEACRILKPQGKIVFTTNFLTCECLEVGGDKLRHSFNYTNFLTKQASLKVLDAQKIGGLFTVQHQLAVKFINDLFNLYHSPFLGRLFSVSLWE